MKRGAILDARGVPGPRQSTWSVIVATLEASGVKDPDAVALALVDAVGGRTLPTVRQVRREADRKRRDAAIRREFNGRNLAAVARRHGLSVRHVRRILKMTRRAGPMSANAR